MNRKVDLLPGQVSFEPVMDVLQRGVRERIGIIHYPGGHVVVILRHRDLLNEAAWRSWCRNWIQTRRLDLNYLEVERGDQPDLLEPGKGTIPCVEWVATPFTVIETLAKSLADYHAKPGGQAQSEAQPEGNGGNPGQEDARKEDGGDQAPSEQVAGEGSPDDEAEGTPSEDPDPESDPGQEQESPDEGEDSDSDSDESDSDSDAGPAPSGASGRSRSKKARAKSKSAK